jgi:hypothetical protein
MYCNCRITRGLKPLEDEESRMHCWECNYHCDTIIHLEDHSKSDKHKAICGIDILADKNIRFYVDSSITPLDQLVSEHQKEKPNHAIVGYHGGDVGEKESSATKCYLLDGFYYDCAGTSRKLKTAMRSAELFRTFLRELAKGIKQNIFGCLLRWDNKRQNFNDYHRAYLIGRTGKNKGSNMHSSHLCGDG